MKRTTTTILCVCTALYVGLVVWTIAERNEARNDAEQAQRALQTAIGERDNAIMLADQYKAQYTNALMEIAEYKQTIEELNEQIETLRQPPDGIYDAEFGYDYDYVVRVVGAEARGEPFAGMLAVAQCIADTAERTGQTPEQVVKGGQYTSPVPRSCTDNMEMVNEACLIVFAAGERPFDEPIEFFYSTANGGYSSWHESQVFCYEIGSHRYFKAKTS